MTEDRPRAGEESPVVSRSEMKRRAVVLPDGRIDVLLEALDVEISKARELRRKIVRDWLAWRKP
jgi:hypothetical protein